MKASAAILACLLVYLTVMAAGCQQDQGSTTSSGLVIQGFSVSTVSPDIAREVHKDLYGREPFSIWTTDMEEYFRYGPPKKEDLLFLNQNPFYKMSKSNDWFRHFDRKP
jgi:hypothetical protein